jgi:molecular chaperone DnaK (HSP70)
MCSASSNFPAAADKMTGASLCITMTKDNGRLFTEEIERMVADAEKYRQKDEEAARRTISSRTHTTCAAPHRRSSTGDHTDERSRLATYFHDRV